MPTTLIFRKKFNKEIDMNTILIPRWSGSAQSDWYPEALSLEKINHVADMPEPQLPRIKTWTQAVKNLLQHNVNELHNTRIVTHSVACHALMKALDELDSEITIGEVVMVAAWWTIDADYWASIGGQWSQLEEWIEYPIDLPKVRSHIKRWRIVLGTEDPLVPNITENTQAWINADVDSVIILPHRKHFNANIEPELFKLIAE
jgi:predicted alpha/beta hydrolase family esterase